MKNTASRWLFLFLFVGFTNYVLADEVQDQILQLKDRDMFVRRSAAVTLGKLGDCRAVEPLISCLNDIKMQSSVAEALGRLGDARAWASAYGYQITSSGTGGRASLGRW